MQYLGYFFEFLYLILIFFVFTVIISGFGLLITKKLLKIKEEIKTLVEWFCVYFLSLFIFQVIGLVLWYRSFSSLMKLADPWVSFFVFSPLNWDKAFKDFILIEPQGLFYTTGQIANLYYGLCLSLILINFFIVVFIVYSRNKVKLLNILVSYGTVIIIQILVLTILSFFSLL